MNNLTQKQELVTLEGWASNKSVSTQERLQAALQVINGLQKEIEQLSADLDTAYEVAESNRRYVLGVADWLRSHEATVPAAFALARQAQALAAMRQDVAVELNEVVKPILEALANEIDTRYRRDAPPRV